MGAPGKTNRLGHPQQVVVHDDDIGRFHGGVGTCCTHGEAYVGLCQRGCIVYAVAGHAGRTVAFLHFFDNLQLGLGQQVATRVRNSRLRRNHLGGGTVVTCEHDRHDA